METTIMQQKATQLQAEVEETFYSHFYAQPVIVRSPGRVNLIGEHTDYNMGFVLPAAIDKYIYAGVSKRNDNQVHLIAGNLNKKHITTLFELAVEEDGWSAYILGVVQQLQLAGYTVGGFNIYLTGDVPVGAGLSSSAAVECAVLFALNELFGYNLSRLEMVKLAKKAENEFVGVQCGIMDMFASIMGKKNAVIQLDCRSLFYEYFPLELGKYKIVLFDTGVKHSLASGEYNLRKQQCEEGVSVLQNIYPNVKSLRDVSFSMLEINLRIAVNETIYNRCRFIVEENLRVQMSSQYLLRNDISEVGKKMFASHKGLKNLYEVSCQELDLLVDMAMHQPAIAGARMLGGGFGGCTINLVKEDFIEYIYTQFAKEYFEKTGLELKMYVTTPQDGTQRIRQ
jgi:galactokinase